MRNIHKEIKQLTIHETKNKHTHYTHVYCVCWETHTTTFFSFVEPSIEKKKKTNKSKDSYTISESLYISNMKID